MFVAVLQVQVQDDVAVLGVLMTTSRGFRR